MGERTFINIHNTTHVRFESRRLRFLKHIRYFGSTNNVKTIY